MLSANVHLSLYSLARFTGTGQRAAINCVVAVATVLGTVGVAGAQQPESAPLHRFEVRSQDFPVDRIYRSMTGPRERQEVRLPSSGERPELLWLRSVRTRLVVVGADRPYRGAEADRFMCHVNVDLGHLSSGFGSASERALRPTRGPTPRLLTLSQGQSSWVLPAGFGLPLWSDEPLEVTMQVLNLNLLEPPAGMTVRHEVEIVYQRHEELQDAAERLTPVFATAAYGLVLVDGPDGYFGVEQPDPSMHGSSCLPGAPVEGPGYSFSDGQGRRFTGHWVVPEGIQENTTNVTRLLNLPYDTTVHYGVAHLHPFARSLVLRGVGSQSPLITMRTQAPRDGTVGLRAVETFSSREGLLLPAGREYQLVSTYRNDSLREQDAMAVLLLYLRDLPFEEQLAAGFGR